MPGRLLLLAIAMAAAALCSAAFPGHVGPGPGRAAGSTAENGTCVDCHAGIEEIHPGYALACVDCHGGDATQKAKDKAHVLPKQQPPGDERVLPETYDLPWQRFVNPSNLRVSKAVCGDCHARGVDAVSKSLHATTCGHLGDGFYEHGITKTRKPSFGVFAVQDEDGDVPLHALRAVTQVPGFNPSAPKDRIETHYADLPRKACMQCHLWSEGRAVRGRLGLDGDYRGQGCAACHVTYAEDGRSKSSDPTIDKLEPGHPLKHRFTSKVPTDTCTHCHYGDASIGLSFQGMAQLVPGMPAGPDVPGTTDKLKNGVFYLKDKDLTPPDVHHQRGMHCIDCHTQADVMGDGNIYPQMDHAVEIECTSCHGTIDAPTDLLTSHGRRVQNLERRGDQVFLRSKVTGREHAVVQVAHVVDPARPEYNPRAAAAMTKTHARLECYTCHAGFMPNFFGFHFDRNEQFTQLDLISGKRTPGRVTTQEKVFATFSQLRLGINHEGMIAPFMVGFSTIGSFHDDKGEPYLHQAMPVTSAGLSGVTLVPHQPHNTRPEARDCVECHRAGPTWGLGSTNFRLAREFAFAVTARSFVTVAVDGRHPARTAPVAELPLPQEARALALRIAPATARATHAYVGCADGTLAVIDLENPVMPRLLHSKKELVDPHRLCAQGDWLFVADGIGGLSIFDLQNPAQPRAVAIMPSVQARALAVQWPDLYLADGPGGLVIVDVADPTAPRATASVDLNGESTLANEAFDVAALFQYSRTVGTDDLGEHIERTPARALAFVACGLDGVRIVDVTDPKAPQVLHGEASDRSLRIDRQDVRGVLVNTQFDLGSQGGGLQSRERDYLFVHVTTGPDQNRQQRLRAFDVSDPLHPRGAPGNPLIYGGSGRLLAFRAYNEPFLQQFVVAVGAGGLGTLVDASKMPTGLQGLLTWDDLDGVRDLQFEEAAFDRLQDERGRAEKDISHEGCRYLSRDELLRVLRARLPVGADGRAEGEHRTGTAAKRQEGKR